MHTNPLTPLNTLLVGSHVVVTNHLRRLGARAREERGEGVISAAIAVLIMAFLGAAMWLAFKGMFDNTSQRTNSQVELIGS